MRASLTVFPLKNAKAVELAEVLKKVFAPQGSGSDRRPAASNQLIVRSDDDTVFAIKRIIEQLDVATGK